MNYTQTDNHLTILCAGPLSGTTAEPFRQEAERLIAEGKPEKVIFDFENVGYISSSGLRVFMALAKKGIVFEIVNVSGDVYEIFDITGFTSLFPIARKIRTVSLENAQLLGSGFFSKVYRISEDSIIKVFIRDTPLEEIKRERELAKSAFLLGIPAAITFDIVDVGGKYGLLFESINGGTFTQKIISDPEHLDAYIVRYAELLKTINTTTASSDNIPTAAEIAAKKLATIRPYITVDEARTLAQLLVGIPNTRTYVHADCHTGNIMLQDDELMIIDLDTLCVGNPIFELASLFCTYTAFEECNPGCNEAFLGLKKEITDKIFYGTAKHYFGNPSPEILDENMKKIRVCGYFHMLYWNKANTPEDQHMFDVCYRRLKECLKEVDNLVLA